MPFTVSDPRHALPVVRADLKIRAERKARQWVLRELDRLGHEQKQPSPPAKAV